MLPFDYARPTSLDEVFGLLVEYTNRARILSGGTDLIVGLRDGKIRPDLVVDLKRVSDLPRTVVHDSRGVTVGAGATMIELIEDAVIQEQFPALVEAAKTVGSIQIRNRATLAGNICNASPAADTMTPLLVYGATITIAGPDGVRDMLVEDFVLGPRTIALQPGELVVSVTIPTPQEKVGSSFARMTRRRGVDLATINLSCAVDASGLTVFGFGAVGPRPFRVIDETGRLADPSATFAERDEVIRQLVSTATPISDLRASREYRLAMLQVTAKRILKTARERLEGKAP